MIPNLMERLHNVELTVGIGEVSHITRATKTQIRYWEKKGLIHSFQREDGGNKRFALPEIVAIMLIKALLDEGYTLAKAAESLQKHRHQADRVKALISLVTVTEDSRAQSVLNFGPIQNDPDFDMVAVIDDTNTLIEKRPHHEEV